MMLNDVTIQINNSEGVEIATAIVGERPHSIEASSNSAESEYIIKITSGDNTENNARISLEHAVPSQYVQGGKVFYRQPVEVEEIADDFWLGTASYSTTRGGSGSGEEEDIPEDIPPDTYSFDTTGGTQHITQSNHTRRWPSATAPDFKGAIGVTDNSVQGVDIYVPGYNFSKTVYKNNAILTPQYLVALSKLTARINQAPFLGFDIGEVLFLGASGSVEQINGVNVDGITPIAMKFSANPNLENYTVGDITVANKKGWDYQWVRYKYNEDDVAKKLIQVPDAVYVEAVYFWGNFSILGIE